MAIIQFVVWCFVASNNTSVLATTTFLAWS